MNIKMKMKAYLLKNLFIFLNNWAKQTPIVCLKLKQFNSYTIFYKKNKIIRSQLMELKLY